jgi:cytidine deaminase
MRSDRALLRAAHEAALRVFANRKQHFKHYALGLRADGAFVHAVNSPAEEPNWTAHAEARLCKRITPKSLVVVVRIRADGSLTQSRPCSNCRRLMRRKGVQRVIYSIDVGEYGIMVL